MLGAFRTTLAAGKVSLVGKVKKKKEGIQIDFGNERILKAIVSEERTESGSHRILLPLLCGMT